MRAIFHPRYTRTVTDALRHATEAREAGYSLVILRPEEKAPLRRGWIDAAEPDAAEVSFELRRGCGFGIRTVPPLVVIDVDGPEGEREDVRSVMETRTRHGRHVYMRLADGVRSVRTRIRLFDLPLDALAGANRFAVGPGTRIERPEPWRYQLVGRIVPAAELPECPPEIVVELTRPVIETTRRRIGRAFHPSRRAVRDPEAYCLRIPSVQGEDGSGQLVRCIAILRDAGRRPDEILVYLTDVWNPQCARPLWSPQELRRAVQRHGG